MKKIFVLLSIALLLVGCSNVPKESAVEIYQKVAENAKGIESSTAHINLTTELEGEGNNHSITIKGYTKETHNPVTYVGEFDLLGETMKTFYIDGYSYIETAGLKYKMKTDFEEFKQISEGSMLSTNFDAEFFKNAKVTKSGEDYVIKTQLNKDLMLKYLRETRPEFGSEDVNIDFKKGNIEMVVNKDYYATSYKMDFEMVIEQMGLKIPMKMKMDLKISDINKTEFTLPTNLDEFEEINPAG